jgi:PIN domain nuclease of toxin-antitoxin system
LSYLLDTHSFIWAVLEPRKLGSKARPVLEDPNSEVVVSAVTFWEIALKAALGKLELEGCSPESLVQAARAHGFELLALEPQTAAGFSTLPARLHKDPFDRMLAWQAISGRLTLVSRDQGMAVFASYGLTALW